MQPRMTLLLPGSEPGTRRTETREDKNSDDTGITDANMRGAAPAACVRLYHACVRTQVRRSAGVQVRLSARRWESLGGWGS